MNSVLAFDFQPSLESPMLKLRPLKLDDFEELYRVASDKLIWQQHSSPDRYQLDIFTNFFNDSLASGGCLIAIDPQINKMIGSSRFYQLDIEKSLVVIGYTFLCRNYWGGIYNHELKKLMVNHALKYVRTVEFHIHEMNMRSQKAMAKIGGKIVGHFLKPNPHGDNRLTLKFHITDLIH